MFPNSEGARVPEVSFKFVEDGQLVTRTTADLFADKTVIVFGLPGAFTPTCSSAHVPRYNQLAPVLQAHGVDDILCVSVNDGFVMSAWQQTQEADRVTFVPDGNGDFTRALGLLVDKQALGFGPRSWRYSMLVRDGIIEKMFIEPDKPGDPYEVSDADTMLGYLAPAAEKPASILVLTRPGCPHCARAKAALRERGLDFEEIEANATMLQAVSHTPTTPRVFIDGELIGGSEELAAWLQR
jgi:glutaredoxin-like protein